MISKSETSKRAAEFLIEKLKESGFKVMRYDAYTTNSIYLKVDDGVVGTIRISDHNGKKHLRYKYNLIKGGSHYSREDKGITRYYFPMKEIELLVSKVLYDRQVLLKKYGQNSYNSFMEKNRDKGKESKGFWQQAKYV